MQVRTSDDRQLSSSLLTREEPNVVLSRAATEHVCCDLSELLFCSPLVIIRVTINLLSAWTSRAIPLWPLSSTRCHRTTIRPWWTLCRTRLSYKGRQLISLYKSLMLHFLQQNNMQVLTVLKSNRSAMSRKTKQQLLQHVQSLLWHGESLYTNTQACAHAHTCVSPHKYIKRKKKINNYKQVLIMERNPIISDVFHRNYACANNMNVIWCDIQHLIDLSGRSLVCCCYFCTEDSQYD